MERQKVALVTGGARGIGRAICHALARDGYRVLINYFSSEAQGRELLETLEAKGHRACLLRADVASPWASELK